MTDTPLKTFILYCQSVETTYTEWKNYWINYYMNNGTTTKDLYDPYDFNKAWLKKQKET